MREGLADDLELPLHCGAKQRVCTVVFQPLSGNNLGDEWCCELNIEEYFLASIRVEERFGSLNRLPKVRILGRRGRAAAPPL